MVVRNGIRGLDIILLHLAKTSSGSKWQIGDPSECRSGLLQYNYKGEALYSKYLQCPYHSSLARLELLRIYFACPTVSLEPCC